MTPNKIRSQLDNALTLFIYKNIAIYSQIVHIIRDRDMTSITWKQTSKTVTKPYKYGAFNQYKGILKDRSYSCILIDGSILRISYTFQKKILISHNLWYFPCPFNIPVNEIRSDPILDLVNRYADQGIQFCNFKGPIRFDYDPNRAIAIRHPASHVHLFDSECRIPVKAPICPGTFFKFVFFNFYPNIWETNPFLQELHEEYFDISLMKNEHKQIHLAWYN